MVKNKIQNILVFFSSILFLVIAGSINNSIQKPVIKITKQQSALNINSEFLSIFNAGYSRMLSDIFWISTLLESDIDHYKGKDLNSWMFLRFKAISELDPKFLQNYQFGGKYLSIIKDDLYGAKEIFEKGLRYYPDDYDLLYNAGFLYSSELGDSKRAYEIYSKLIEYPQAPAYLRTLLPKLQLEQDGNIKIAFKYLEELLKVEKDNVLKNKIKVELYAIKATIDLECLNRKKENCDLKDYNNNYYIKKNGLYFSKEKYKPYRINRKIR